MTTCYADGGAHEFPVEDDTGAHCPEHGITLLWHGTPDGPTTPELPPRPPIPWQDSDRAGSPPIQQDGGTTMRTTDTRPSTPPGRCP
ncbi:hypothetical protein [Streptomyces anulatus]|uniref:hypothetical protein n=1 Tax=Streptomyces anulatus TaxID=1892 RepID=UPI001D1921AC|nr:hypothetical protein [Streptomyces anulatus]